MHRERLMRVHSWEGVRRVTKIRTTIADPGADRAPDLVKRQFRAPVPGRLVVADFTYVRMANGCFAYTAFAIDAFANRIVGWDCATTKHTSFVETAIRQSAALRVREGHTSTDKAVHHSDAGSQYTSVHFGEILFLEGFLPSIGTVGDAYDNALAETTIGLYKHECVRADSPFRDGPLDRLSDLEMITGLGPLVQHPPAHAPPRTHPACRGRSQLLCSNP